ncbi:MAG: c-type cytochrome [Candidatus Puniceispirillales bacterium]
MSLKNKFFIILVLITLPILYFFTTYSNKSNASINLNLTDSSIIENGKKVYANNCASCHGINLEGQKNWMSRLPDGLMPAPPHDETGHTWHHPDRYLFMVTKYGIEELIGEKYLNNMPVYKDILSDEEIIAVLSYIKSTWPSKIKKIHDQINNREKSK